MGESSPEDYRDGIRTARRARGVLDILAGECQGGRSAVVGDDRGRGGGGGVQSGR
jgi:hypothetical protein